MAKRVITYNCAACDGTGAVSIPCGYCKEKAAGKRNPHTFCNECFLKGCPKVYPSKFVEYWARRAFALTGLDTSDIGKDIDS